MKIAVIGSREGFTKEFVWKKLAEFWDFEEDRLITGGARGVDTYADNFAESEEWGKYGSEIIRPVNPANKLDYLFRNIEIITKADKIIAFWDGKSRGTKFVIDYAKARQKEIEIIYNENSSV